jgi:hypothetical protein
VVRSLFIADRTRSTAGAPRRSSKCYARCRAGTPAACRMAPVQACSASASGSGLALVARRAVTVSAVSLRVLSDQVDETAPCDSEPLPDLVPCRVVLADRVRGHHLAEGGPHCAAGGSPAPVAWVRGEASRRPQRAGKEPSRRLTAPVTSTSTTCVMSADERPMRSWQVPGPTYPPDWDRCSYRERFQPGPNSPGFSPGNVPPFVRACQAVERYGGGEPRVVYEPSSCQPTGPQARCFTVIAKRGLRPRRGAPPRRVGRRRQLSR